MPGGRAHNCYKLTAEQSTPVVPTGSDEMLRKFEPGLDGRAEGARDAFVAAAKASGGRVIERDLAPAPEAPEPTMMLDVRWRQPSDQYADSLGAMIDGASSCCA